MTQRRGYGPPVPLYNPFSNTPLLGKWYGRVGRVIHILSLPCQPTPQIWVYAAFVSTPRLLWSLFKPDFIDLKYDQVKAGFKRHGRKGKFKIHTMDVPKYPTPRGLGWAVFEAAEFAQRVGWYLCVIDATTEFAVNWTTLAYQYQGCTTPGVAHANMNLPDPKNFGPLPGQFTVTGWNTLSEDGFAGSTSGIGIPAGFNYTASAGVAVTDPHIPGYPFAPTTFKIVDVANNVTIATLDENVEPDGSRTYQTQSFQPFGPKPLHNLRLIVEMGAGVALVTSGSFTAYGSKLKLDLDLKPDP